MSRDGASVTPSTLIPPSVVRPTASDPFNTIALDPICPWPPLTSHGPAQPPRRPGPTGPRGEAPWQRSVRKPPQLCETALVSTDTGAPAGLGSWPCPALNAGHVLLPCSCCPGPAQTGGRDRGHRAPVQSGNTGHLVLNQLQRQKLLGQPDGDGEEGVWAALLCAAPT